MQSSSQIVTANKPTHNFLQTGCPSCRPTNSVKALCPRPHRVEAFSNDACLTSICLSNVCLSRTLGLNREQSQWAGSLLSAARPLATCRGAEAYCGGLPHSLVKEVKASDCMFCVVLMQAVQRRQSTTIL